MPFKTLWITLTLLVSSVLWSNTSLAFTGTAETINNGFVESPECPIRYEHWLVSEWRPIPFLNLPKLYGNDARSHAILTWFYGGAAAVYERGYARETLSKCLENGSCGLEKNRKIAKILKKDRGDWSDRDLRRFNDYFSQSPPDEAIAEGTVGLGRCFGDHPAQKSMEEAGFMRYDFTPESCEIAQKNAYTLTFSQFAIYSQFFNPKTDCIKGAYVPTPIVAKLDELLAKQREEERWAARIAAYRAKRPVAERIKGLNGCQIAYGLIHHGINNPDVSRIPDAGVRWALAYEQARIKDEACPLIPKALSNWVQAQSLKTFEPAQDPFIYYRNNMPRGNSNLDHWSNYVRTVMHHYERPDNPHNAVPAEHCSAFATWLNGKKHSQKTDARYDWQFLFDVLANSSGRTGLSVCAQAPASMIYQFFSDQRLAQQQRAAAQRRFEAEQKRKQAADAAFQSLLRWKPSYNPPASEPRCYRRDDITEICFQN